MRKFLKNIYHLMLKDKRYIASFLTIGALSAIVYFTAFTFFWNMIKLPYQYAVSLAYVISVIFHFTGNRNITFKSNDPHLLFQLIRYLGMVLTNYLITLAIVHLVVEKLQLSPYIGIVISIGTTVWTGFLMSRLWVFRSTMSEH